MLLVLPCRLIELHAGTGFIGLMDATLCLATARRPPTYVVASAHPSSPLIAATTPHPLPPQRPLNLRPPALFATHHFRQWRARPSGAVYAKLMPLASRYLATRPIMVKSPEPWPSPVPIAMPVPVAVPNCDREFCLWPSLWPSPATVLP
ncbi:hypothetical protein NL676_034922 [Syzygium grande]|nr:hypothetical protein NL676_034922 [Syzygium grande]